MIRDYRDIELTVERPTPIDKEVGWNKSQVVISETDVYGRITNVNDVFCNVCGYSPEEMIGQPHSIIRHPDMPKLVFKLLWDNLKVGNNFIGVIKNLAKSGEYYWVITDFDIIRDPSGQIINYMGRRTSVPAQTIEKHIAPLYQKILQVEQAGGVEAGEQYFQQFLKEQGKDYLTYIEDVILEFK